MKQSSKSEPLNAAEILAKGREPRKFLVTQAARSDSGKKPLGIIPENSYTLLVAESGHGKTWISLDLARLMATPQEQRKPPLNWLGMYEVEPRKVLYLDEENGEPLLGERLARLGLSETADLIVWSRSRLKMDDPKHLDQIIKVCNEKKCQVVFLDSLVRFHRCEENDAQAMAFVADSIRTLVAANLTVIVLHHTRKGGGRNEDKLRGSSEITAGADTVLFLENWRAEAEGETSSDQSPNWDLFTLTATKLRYASKQEFFPHNFRRKEKEDAICFVSDTSTKRWRKQPSTNAAEAKEAGVADHERKKKDESYNDYVLRQVHKLTVQSGSPPTREDLSGNRKAVLAAVKCLVESVPPSLIATRRGKTEVLALAPSPQKRENSARAGGVGMDQLSAKGSSRSSSSEVE